MAKVYVLHKAFRWVSGEREVFDYTPANIYGEVVVVFENHRPPGLAQALPRLRDVFRDYTPADFLVMSGDTDLVVWASVLALKATGGRLTLLKWNNRERRYDPVHAPDGLL